MKLNLATYLKQTAALVGDTLTARESSIAMQYHADRLYPERAARTIKEIRQKDAERKAGK